MTSPEHEEVYVPLPVADDLSDATLTALAQAHPDYQALLTRLWVKGQRRVTLRNPATGETCEVVLPDLRRRLADSLANLFTPSRRCPCCQRLL